ncbi:hypothetical protein ACFOD4_20700, partial [Pseudoroseomonas globiformis]
MFGSALDSHVYSDCMLAQQGRRDTADLDSPVKTRMINNGTSDAYAAADRARRGRCDRDPNRRECRRQIGVATTDPVALFIRFLPVARCWLFAAAALGGCWLRSQPHHPVTCARRPGIGHENGGGEMDNPPRPVNASPSPPP